MKTLVFSSIAVATFLLVGWQHQQLSHLRAENTSLMQSASEADRLKADLAQSAGMEAQDADEIARLREENHDLLKLRNEVNQLRDARATFEKVSAENQRLQEQVRTAAKINAKQAPMQPILIRVDSLYDRGLNTPENAMQTFFWAERSGNVDELSRCMAPEHWSRIYGSVPEQDRKSLIDGMRHSLDGIFSIEIFARRELDTDTVQLGVQTHDKDGVLRNRIMFTFSLRRGEWVLGIGNINALNL